MASLLSKERIIAKPGFNRWLVPPASIAIHLCIGSAYAWSIYNPALIRVFGVVTPAGDDWSLGSVVRIFTLAIIFLGIAAAVAGKWLEEVGPRKVGVVAALCWGGGYLVGGLGIYLHQLWLVYLGYGVIGGCGLGLGYVSPVSTLIRWFPDRRGMATGMAIMGFGGGAMIGAPLKEYLKCGASNQSSERSIVQAGIVSNIAGAVFAGVLLAGCSPDTAPQAGGVAAIHDRVIALDTHVDIPFDFATEAVDPLSGDLQVNLQSMRSGGLDAAFFVVYVGQTERTPENYARAAADALVKFDAIHRMTDVLYPDLIGLAYSADDVERLIGEGRLVAAIGIENGYVLGRDLSLLDRYLELGARYITLVHNGHNDIGDSAQPRPQLGDEAPEHDGLSEFGARVVERMNQLGIMVDISHASKQTALDAIAQSRAPVIGSHSSVSGVASHARNMDDETLLALRENGGVVQIVALDAYVRERPPERDAAMQALEDRLGLDGRTNPDGLPPDLRIEYENGIDEIDARWPRASVADFVDHIDYAVELIGIDHVGISSDFGGGGGIVGWNSAAETPNITEELVARGYTEEEIAKLWSGNLLRVWREVERIAARSTEQ